MKLNADFSLRATVHAAKLDWVASPMVGVERRMLDRVGDEVARATSIVRYAPHSAFSAHVHTGGEEFLVLDGVFQDEHGDFAKGAYIRNPPQSQHTPRSEAGCVIFVKLWQFDPDDRTHVRIDTSEMAFVPAADRAHREVMPLFHDEREDVRLERWAPNAAIEIAPDGGLEVLVLAGGFKAYGDGFVEQSWLRLPVGARRLQAKTGAVGCRVWIKEGHLRYAQSGPVIAQDVGDKAER